MPDKLSLPNTRSDYQTLFREMGDEQLKKVLRQRKLYQDEAAKIAVDEAIKRKIIHSEQDLLEPEYNSEPLRTGLFPKIGSPGNKNKIRKSIARSLLLVGILPTIWGVVRINSGFGQNGFLILIFGIVWIALSAVLLKYYYKAIVGALLGLLTGSAVYVISFLFRLQQIEFMDLLITVAIYLLVLYGLLFLMWIHKNQKEV